MLKPLSWVRQGIFAMAGVLGGLALAAPATAAAGDTIPPSAPPWVVGTEGFGAYLAWAPSADDVTPTNELAYAVYIDGVESTRVSGGMTFVNYFDYAYCVVLLPAGTHTYTVRAIDKAGNMSMPSQEVVLTNLE